MQLNVTIKHLSGTHASIGQKLAKNVESDYFSSQLSKMKGSYLYSALGMKYELDEDFINKSASYLLEVLEQYHPDLLTEVKAFSEALHQPLAYCLAFLLNYGNGKGCTQLFANGLHGHNYDDHPRNVDMQFLVIQPENSFTSAGFSLGHIGRLDGMNEKGLSVSLSWGAGTLGNTLKLSAELFMRIILDKSSTIEEAIDIFNSIGYGSPNNLLISDATSNAVIIENSGNTSSIRALTENNILFSANRYLSGSMQNEQKYNNPTTVWREGFISSNVTPALSKTKMKDFLTSTYPHGLFEPYYQEELGTLWSVIFEPKEKVATILIGEKENRIERTVDLTSEITSDLSEMLCIDVPEDITSKR